jgi:hypothetical protein
LPIPAIAFKLSNLLEIAITSFGIIYIFPNQEQTDGLQVIYLLLMVKLLIQVNRKSNLHLNLHQKFRPAELMPQLAAPQEPKIYVLALGLFMGW